MNLLFLVILSLFSPSCARANLRKLGVEASQLDTMNNPRALSTVSRHLMLKFELLNKFYSNLHPSHSKSELDVKFTEELTQTFPSRKAIVEGEEKELKLDSLFDRMKTYEDIELSEEGLRKVFLLEIERGSRWNSGQIVNKQSGTSMMLQRSEQEIEEIKSKGGKILLSSSLVGRQNQLVLNEEKVMAFCIVLRHRDGGSIVRTREGEEGLWFAEEPDVKMVIISSSSQHKTSWITVKGGRNKDETPEQAALRETLEECGYEATIRTRLDDMVVDHNEKKSRWETWIMDAGHGAGEKYDIYSEDSRLRGLFSFSDAVKLINRKDPRMAENVEKMKTRFGTQYTDKDAMLAEKKLKMSAND